MLPEYQSLLNSGIGGIIAAIVLYWKRNDDKAYREALESKDKLYVEALIRHAEQLAKANDKVLDVVTANTKVMSELVVSINTQARLRRHTDLSDATESHA